MLRHACGLGVEAGFAETRVNAKVRAHVQHARLQSASIGLRIRLAFQASPIERKRVLASASEVLAWGERRVVPAVRRWPIRREGTL
jgi:hypothetical protein